VAKEQPHRTTETEVVVELLPLVRMEPTLLEVMVALALHLQFLVAV
jgi:hypothetical protein